MNIKLQNISFSYQDGRENKEIFRDFSLDIKNGEFIILLGPSGCGKSTLLNIIGGLLAPKRGQVFLGEKEYYEMSVKQQDEFRRKHIGYVFQKFYLIEDLSPVDNISITMSDELSAKEKKKRITKILSSLDIADKINSKINTFSGGEQQRLAIARAIAQDSDLLICDEPTGSLDEYNSIQIMKILKRLNREGKTILMVTHNKELCSYATRILELTPDVRLGGVKK